MERFSNWSKIERMVSTYFSSYNLNQNTPGVKKEQPRVKRPCWKRYEIKMSSQGVLLLIGLKILIIMTSLQNIVISGAQGLLMLMGSQFLTKMKTLLFHFNVLWPGHLCQKFWSHQHQETLSTWNNNTLQWGHDD